MVDADVMLLCVQGHYNPKHDLFVVLLLACHTDFRSHPHGIYPSVITLAILSTMPISWLASYDNSPGDLVTVKQSPSDTLGQGPIQFTVHVSHYHFVW